MFFGSGILDSITPTYSKPRCLKDRRFQVHGHASIFRRFRRPLSTAAPTLLDGGEDDDKDIIERSIIPFMLADIGEGIAEVELLQWYVQEGEEVRQFDRICEVQSDKATVEITSRYDGTITSLEAKVGEMVPVGSPLLLLESQDGESGTHPKGDFTSSDLHPFHDSTRGDELLDIPSTPTHFHLPSDDRPVQSKSMDPLTGKVLTSPAIRKLAKENDLDLTTIRGSGPKGRILKGDILAILKERDTGVVSTSSGQISSPLPSTQSETPVASNVTSLDQVDLPLAEDVTLELRGYHRLMAQTMEQSLQIPHMVFADEVVVTTLLSQKADLKFLPFCLKAISQALLHYPALNSRFDENEVRLLHRHNLGIAMDTPRGLVVPVIHDCNDKSLDDIHEELIRLKALGQEGNLKTEDLEGATFTLSNIGAIGGGGTYMSPIIPSPQVCIGAMGKIQRLPRFVGNSMDVEEAKVLNISWGADHRAVDGATLSRFHSQWKTYMENPVSLLRQMK